MRRRTLVLVLLLLIAGGAGGYLALHPEATGHRTSPAAVTLPVEALVGGRSGVNQALTEVAALSHGFVTIGNETSGGSSRPLFLHSSDGRVWTEGTTQGADGFGDTLDDVAAGSAGALAFGTGPEGPVTWSTPTGAVWTRAVLDRTVFTPDDNVNDVAALPARGWIAVGSTSTSTTPSRGVVWTSPNGVAWTRRTAAELRLPLRYADEYFRAVAVRGRQVVVVGSELQQGAPRNYSRIAMWHSEDLGHSWRRAATEPTLGGHNGGNSFLLGVAATATGFTAVGAGGESYFDDDYNGITLTSADGEHWLRDALESPELVAQGNESPQSVVQTADRTTFIAGTRDDDALLAARTATGTDKVTRPGADGPGQQTFKGLAALGNTVVAVGADGASGDDSPVLLTRSKGTAFVADRLPPLGSLTVFAQPTAGSGGDVVGSVANDAAWWSLRTPSPTEIDLSGVATASGTSTQSLSAVASRGATSVAVGYTEEPHAYLGLLLVRHGVAPPQSAQPTSLWRDQANDYAGHVLRDVTASGAGFVAVGYATTGTGVTSAAAFRSNDGDTWSAITSPTFTGVVDRPRYLTSVAASPHAVLAGGATTAARNAPRQATVWLSPDRSHWVTHALGTPSGWTDATVSSVTWTGTAWVVAGSASKAGAEHDLNVTWTSADGVHWEAPVAVDTTAQNAAVSGVVAVGTHLVAVGAVGKDEDRDAAGWESTDGGRTWKRLPSLDAVGPGQQGWTAVQVVGADLVLVGTSESRQQQTSLVRRVPAPGR